MLTLDHFFRPSDEYPDWMVYDGFDYIECTIAAAADGGYFARVSALYYRREESGEFSKHTNGESPQDCLDWINRTLPDLFGSIRKRLVKEIKHAEENLREFERQCESL